LFLFVRDIAGGDIVGWIDRQVADHLGNLPAARAALVDPLRHVYGISDKVIAMALASFLMGAGRTRPGWFAVGASFVVVDTLVHNFLHRTGILDRLGAGHPYGPSCYRPGGCADILIGIATAIDARRRQRPSLAARPRLSVNLEPKGAVGPLLDSGECHDSEISHQPKCCH
jgi:hypothetical protein